MLDEKTDYNVIICDQCGGVGYHWFEERLDGYGKNTRQYKEECCACQGSGRLSVETTTRIKPFGVSK